MTDRDTLLQIKALVDVALNAPVVVVPPTPVPPVVQPPVVTPGPYVASGLWIPGKNRLSTGDMTQGQYKEAPFTIPSGWSGYVEVGISGANLQVFIDGQIYGDGRYDLGPGPHTLRVVAAATAAGSIDLYHYPV